MIFRGRFYVNIPHPDAATSQYPTKLAYYPTRVAYKVRFAAPTKDIFKRNYSIVMGYYL